MLSLLTRAKLILARDLRAGSSRGIFARVDSSHLHIIHTVSLCNLIIWGKSVTPVPSVGERAAIASSPIL